MATLQNARPEPRARADSLSRMLELEKKYKMQRLQDTGSPPPPSPTPLARANTRSSSSAQPDSALKARRASAHPPVSHHKAHMMLNTTRRSSGLPPLSISVPPSLTSTSVLAVRAEDSEPAFHALGSPENRPRETLERTKTVTFSEPEEEEADDNNLSDQSSICQSPSWQVYGQKKQKSRKREAAQKKKEQERQEKQLKNSTKKRLSKAAPKRNPETRPAHPERALSAPELVESQNLGERPLSHSTSHYPPDSMANHHHHLRQQSVDSSTKPKSKGFFSNFRFSSSNSIPTQKAEVEDYSQNMENADPFKVNSALPGQTPGLGSDMRFLNPRKPPSVKSTQSSSTRSQNSLERQSGKGRTSFSHSRSNSLLAKIRGPSYLYAKNSEPTEDTGSERPESSGNLEVKPKLFIHGQNPNEVVLARDILQRTDTLEEDTSRGRSIVAHIPQPREPSSDYEDTHVTESSRHHGKPVVPNVPVANESRRRPSAYVGQTKIQHQTLTTISPLLQIDDESEGLGDVVQETRCNFPRLSQPAQSVHHQVAVFDQPTPTMSPESNKSYATIYTDAVDRLSESHSPYKEEGLSLPPAHMSAISPGSCEEDSAKLANILHEPASLPSARLVKVGPDHPSSPGSAKRITISPNTGVVPLECLPQAAESQSGPREHRREKSADYFAFISESYAPPSLELRSPIEEDKQSYHSTEEKIAEDDCEVADMAWATLPIQGLVRGEEELTEVEANSCLFDSSKEGKDSESCDSPTLSAHDDVSIKLEEKSQHFSVPLGEELSQSVSERSSSSTCDDPLFSPSTVTTPDNSRPQSQHGTSDDEPKPTANVSRAAKDTQRVVRGVYRSKVLELPQRLAGQDALMQGAPPQIDVPTSPQSKYMTQSPSPEGTGTFDIPSDMSEDITLEKMPMPRRQHLPARTQSAIDLSRSASSFVGKSSSSAKTKNKAGLSSTSLPNSPPPEMDSLPPPPHRSALKKSRNSSSTSPGSTTILSSGAYLQEARKAALITTASSRTLRGVQRQRPPLPHLKSSTSSENRGEPMAKVLVECCNCHFFHDMPSRVYECMAKPDSIVEDKQLGVSAAITTTVKCPWCTHGMTTQCCSGYAAMVYLKEKLHGQ